MKAYILKISINDTHPPIWRRVAVPAGISFSQLNIILNTAMDWCGYHLSEYTFRDYRVRIVDEPDEFFDAYDDYEFIDAADTCIDEFLDDEDLNSFTYLYDFGDNWRHTVKIEKRISDYTDPCPAVIKFKGDTPWEDCGGVWGFYEYQEILKNPEHEEYEMIKEWTGGRLRKYDVDLVNMELSRMTLSPEIHEPMSTAEVYDAYFNNDPLYTINFPDDFFPGFGLIDEDGGFSFGEDDLVFSDVTEEMIQNFEAKDMELKKILDKYLMDVKDKEKIMSMLIEANIRFMLSVSVNEQFTEKIIELMGEEKGLEYVNEVYLDLENKMTPTS